MHIIIRFLAVVGALILLYGAFASFQAKDTAIGVALLCLLGFVLLIRFAVGSR